MRRGGKHTPIYDTAIFGVTEEGSHMFRKHDSRLDSALRCRSKKNSPAAMGYIHPWNNPPFLSLLFFFLFICF